MIQLISNSPKQTSYSSVAIATIGNVNNGGVALHLSYPPLVGATAQSIVSSEPLLARWNAIGEIQVQHRFGDEPRFSFQFKNCRSCLESIKTELANGSEHTCFGYRWVVESLQITKVGLTGVIGVTVNLVHFYSSVGNPSLSPIDNLVKLKIRNKSIRSISELANVAGVSYRGKNFSIKTARSLSSSDTTTVIEILNNRAITQHGFLFYGKKEIELREWQNTARHYLSDKNIKSDSITFNYGGHGSELESVNLHTEYRNLKVNLDFSVGNSNDNDTSKGVTTEWVFENCESLADLYSPKQLKGAVYVSPNSDILKSPGNNFDSGGRTKKATKIIRFNGTPTFNEEIVAGYAYTSDEVYKVKLEEGAVIIEFDEGASPESYWKEIERSTTDWIYDNDGYLVATRKKGTLLNRVRQETENNEAVNNYALALKNALDENGITSPNPRYMNIVESYKFERNLPINDTTTYILNSHRNYYDDTVRASSCEEVKDKNFVEPKFVRSMNRYQEDYFVDENPENNDTFTYPPIISGKFTSEYEKVSIVSKNKYEKRSRSLFAEGESFKNTNYQSTTEFHDGKPGIHTRLDRETFANEITDYNYQLYKDGNYYLNSVGINNKYLKVDEGSKSYPDINDPYKVMAIAETELSIINTRNSLTTKLEIDLALPIEEGDFIVWRDRTWKVLAIARNFQVNINKLSLTKTVLDLGLYLEPKLKLENRSPINCITS